MKSNLSEKEESALLIILQAYPKMTEFEKGYFLGRAEKMADDKREEISQKKDEELIPV